jgi:catechol 2,3-dioxygenase-like lactoylglutathione lyase family enzyme
MLRFHLSVSVSDLEQSVLFYTSLFGRQPDLLQPDYARWMLDEPLLNISLNTGRKDVGVNHVGLQAGSVGDLRKIRERLVASGEHVVNQDSTTCCYSRSTKTWLRDPDGLSWETFLTHETESATQSPLAAKHCCSDTATNAKACCA